MSRIPLRQGLAAGMVAVFVAVLQLIILWRTQAPPPGRGFAPQGAIPAAAVQPG